MEENKEPIIVTLTHVYNQREILLGMKKRGFGAGFWNGFGGKPEKGETIEQTASRELMQESGIVEDNLVPAGVFNVRFEGKEKIFEIHLFRVAPFFGPAQETEEMRGQWFARDAIPFNQMWVNDKLWLEHFLEGKNVEGFFLLDEKGERVIESKINFFDSGSEMKVK
jgi:8-oxo-dGTP diphosphatase/2-hydroxy-dATP diphosphatase